MNFLKQEESLVSECYKHTLYDYIHEVPYVTNIEDHKETLKVYLNQDEAVSSRLIWNLRGVKNSILIPEYMKYMLVKYNDVKQDQIQVKSRDMMAELITLFDETDNGELLPVNPDLLQIVGDLEAETGIVVPLPPKSTTLDIIQFISININLFNSIFQFNRFKFWK